MANKNWRDAPSTKTAPSPNRAGWGNSPATAPISGAGKAFYLLASAGVLGALIALYLWFLPPAKKTPLVFFDSFPASKNTSLFSTQAFVSETADRLTHQTSQDLATSTANARNLNEKTLEVPHVENGAAFFYVYGDLFVGADQQTYLLTNDQAKLDNSLQPAANYSLRKFLESICQLDVGECHRVVVLDCGRQDWAAFGAGTPEPIGDSVQAVLDEMHDSNVSHCDQLWILLATDNYQLGWTAPELKGSVFGYFFSAGLRGEADQPPLDQKITLAELNEYVQDSVAKWVEDYRDSAQTPRLLHWGDQSTAEKIHLLAHHHRGLEPISGLPSPQTGHDDLWSRAFAIEHPQFRQMAIARLIRLEQLRYCQSKEYAALLDQVKTILLDAGEAISIRLANVTDVCFALEPEEFAAATNASALADFEAFLNPPANIEIKPRDVPPAEASAVKSETKQPLDSNLSGAIADPSVPTGFAQPLGPAIQHLTSRQRLALVWHAFNSKTNPTELNRDSLDEVVNFIRLGNSANVECDSFVQMQLLVLLQKSLPWGKPGFDNRLPVLAVQCFEASQRMLQPSRVSSVLDSALPQQYSVWLDWPHVQAEFEELENRRRQALDRSIAGDSAAAVDQFSSMLTQYDQLQNQLERLIDARRAANEAVFVVPYLKAFAIRESSYRQHGKNVVQDFCFSLKTLDSLATSAQQMLNSLNESALTDDDIKQLAELTKNVSVTVNELRDRCQQFAGDSVRKQTASKYALNSFLLLSSPLPEWIDVSLSNDGSTRKKIVDQLNQLLREQQKTFVEKIGSDSRRERTAIEQWATHQREIVSRKLVEFDNAFNHDSFAAANLIGWQPGKQWNEVQVSLKNLKSLHQLKNGRDDGALLSFDSGASLTDEVQRLNRIDQQIRLAGPVIGLVASPSDIYQQQVRLQQYIGQQRLLNRAAGDFWGTGEVTNFRQQPPPFLVQVNSHADNLASMADQSFEFRLTENYEAYEISSFKSLANAVVQQSVSRWSAFRDLQPQWQFNGSWLPLTDRNLEIEPDSERRELNIGLESIGAVLTEGPYLTPGASGPRPLTGQQLTLNRAHEYGPLEIPTTLRNARANGTVLFRGHQFSNSLFVSQTLIEKIPPQTFVFHPAAPAAGNAVVTVENRVDNEVNLMFLIDCSDSMGGDLEKVKAKIREVMLELAKENRFYIGLAAFGNRGKFELQRDAEKQLVTVNNRIPIQGKIHPFQDFELLRNIPSEVSDQAQVEDLCDQELETLIPNGLTTPLYYSIKKTLPYLVKQDRKNVLIVVTDGEDNQYPKEYVGDQRWEPPLINGQRVSTTGLSELMQFQKRYSEKFTALVLGLNRGQENKLPDNFTPVGLGRVDDIKSEVLKFVGRYQYSVTPTGTSVAENDRQPMGQALPIRVTPNQQYIIQTHGVPHPSTETVTLSNGGNYKFYYTQSGLKLASMIDNVEPEFLEPKLSDTIALGSAGYRIGLRPSNKPNNVRIGFFNRRSISQFPDRVWTHIRDDQGREFGITVPGQEFAEMPTYDFELPVGLGDNKPEFTIEMTLFILPPNSSSTTTVDRPTDEEAGSEKLEYFEIIGESSGEFRGLKYHAAPNKNSPSRFTVTIAPVSGVLNRDFHLECPHSVPIEPDNSVMNRVVKFEDINRIDESYEFEIPLSVKQPTFRLYVQTPEKWESAMSDRAEPGKSKNVTDPIFGDAVVAVELGTVTIKN